ncbi:glycosyltransferase [Candidatus Peregrinibacteria bacterium]|nr:glycosyltransferase [Candidatus Peregrinibacteria bacterium]
MPATIVQILLPTFEPRSDFLRAAVESVITQTETRWMLSIHDDASTIDVRTIVEPYLADPRITFARNPHRLGIGGNWNACLRQALGPGTWDLGPVDSHLPSPQSPAPSPYIQFLFQDDLWSFDYLERMCGILENHPTVGFVSGEHEYDCEEEIPTTPLYRALEETRRNLLAPGLHNGLSFLQWWLWRGLHPNFIGEPSFVMMRRCLIEHVGLFNETMQQFLDVEYWTRCLTQADWYYLGENLGTFRVHSEGASERNRRKGLGMVDRLLCIEHALAFAPMRRAEQKALLRPPIPLLLRSAPHPMQRGSPPFSPKQIFHYSPSSPPKGWIVHIENAVDYS